MEHDTKTHQKAIIGNVNEDFWLYDSQTGFDLTRPSPPTAAPTAGAITLQTTTSPVTIDPAKSALVIIDMQNFFLSTALGRPPDSKGLKAQEQLLKHAIPAARKTGIKIAWLNWGLSDEDLESFPPAIFRAFGFSTMPADEFNDVYSSPAGAGPGAGQKPPSSSSASVLCEENLGKDSRTYKGLGQPLGDVTLSDGRKIPAGRMLMRDQWNTDLSPPLQESYEASLRTANPDVWLHKNRITGLYLPASSAGVWFRDHGIKTLIFAGVNTDQCVNGTMTDAFAHGYDCIMLRDGCATTSPDGAQSSVEYNIARMMGFAVDCEGFGRDVEASLAK